MSSTPPVIVIRRAETSADYQACQAAQRRAWGITADGYVVPVATMVGAQLHGGVVQGIGWALYEGMTYDGDGQLLTATLMESFRASTNRVSIQSYF